MDIAILIWIQEHMRTDWLTPAIQLINTIGHYGAFWLVLALVLALHKATRQQGILVTSSILFCGGIAEILKHLVMRPRPFLTHPELLPLGHLPHSFSFPSGHTVCAFAAAFILWRICRGWYRYLGLGLAAFMAFSRLYVGVHYPSDILGGIGIAALGSAAIWHCRNKLLRYTGISRHLSE